MGSLIGHRCRTSRVSGCIKLALLEVIIFFCFQGALCEVEPTESQCRPYIEKALKEQHLEGHEIPEEKIDKEIFSDQEESPLTDELTDSTEVFEANEDEGKGDDNNDDEAQIKRKDKDDENEKDKNEEDVEEEKNDEDEKEDIKQKPETETDDDADENYDKNEGDESEQKDEEKKNNAITTDDDVDDDDVLDKPIDIEIQEIEIDDDDNDEKDEEEEEDEKKDKDVETNEKAEDEKDEEESEQEEDEKIEQDEQEDEKVEEKEQDEGEKVKEDEQEGEKVDEDEEEGEEVEENEQDESEKVEDEQEGEKIEEDEQEGKKVEENEQDESEKVGEEEQEGEKIGEEQEESEKVEGNDQEDKEEKEEEKSEIEEDKKEDDDDDDGGGGGGDDDDDIQNELPAIEGDKDEKTDIKKQKEVGDKESRDEEEEKTEKEVKVTEAEEVAESDAEKNADQEAPEEEELINEVVIPENLRPRDHIDKILRLEDSGVETILEKTIDSTLKALKALYDNAIKPLEMLYKYRDLSNRHFGDPEIFSKPLILFMGPWSGGKSSTINYLLDNEFSRTSLRTGAEPSPAYFNILMHGEEEEILDGTQLAADWTFSGLQKFGQGLLDRLKGIKLQNKLLEKVNIVEIPGILEIRKQVQRLFPFNDACQWFIDRADIIFLVYDPSKLDVGPETEAILDQLKGREYQTRIILNKADQVKPEELMRVQGTLIWNISPLMSSSEPPIMYSTSLWSLPYEIGAPIRLLQAQERAFLKDLREAIDKRVENKISSARRFAVRVRNHAKMVDCYLTTYYNHKTIFGNRKKISDDIIEYPQKYHIYEGLSTLTNISRYDLPDPDVYRDFFKINPLYEFKKLSETCTYFRGCPINKLDVAIAYDLPELVGKYRKAVETAKERLQKENS